MAGARRGKVIDELAEGTTIVSAVPCGVISIILVGDGTNLGTIKLYDHAATATGNIKKALSVKTNDCIVYTPCRPDAFSVGCVAVVTNTSGVSTAYVSIEPV